MGVNTVVKHGILFNIGGFVYYYLELLYRGHSTWQMIAVGGLCFVLVGLINELFPWSMPLWLQSIIATVVVTTTEYISGLLLNMWLKLGIWDYSQLPFNLYGQICLYYSLTWLALSLVAIILDDLLRYWLFGEDRPKYKVL
jgi:uncharacterized membrane protein